MSADIHEDDDSQTAVPLAAAQIDAFWHEFSARLGSLKPLESREFVEQANELLQPFAPDLALELEGGPKDTTARLVVSAHGNPDQFENAQAMVRRAPRLEGYEVAAFRSRSQGSDFAMRMNDFELSCSDVLVGHYDAGGVIGLELSFEKIIPQDMVEHARHMAFIMLDHVLGEWDFAVRVGPVEFVDAFSDEVAGAEPLSVFPPIFDAFLREEMGRTYQYPQEHNDQWVSLEVRASDADEDDPPDILMFREAANAVATRADLSHLMLWTFPFDSQETLDQVRDAQDALDTELEHLHQGILVFSRVEQMSRRTAAYYVESPEQAVQLAEKIGAQHAPGISADIDISFDPAWREYLSLYRAIHARRNSQDEDDE